MMLRCVHRNLHCKLPIVMLASLLVLWAGHAAAQDTGEDGADTQVESEDTQSDETGSSDAAGSDERPSDGQPSDSAGVTDDGEAAESQPSADSDDTVPPEGSEDSAAETGLGSPEDPADVASPEDDAFAEDDDDYDVDGDIEMADLSSLLDLDLQDQLFKFPSSLLRDEVKLDVAV